MDIIKNGVDCPFFLRVQYAPYRASSHSIKYFKDAGCVYAKLYLKTLSPDIIEAEIKSLALLLANYPSESTDIEIQLTNFPNTIHFTSGDKTLAVRISAMIAAKRRQMIQCRELAKSVMHTCD